MTRKVIVSGPIHGPLTEAYEDRGHGGGAVKAITVYGGPPVPMSRATARKVVAKAMAT